MKKLLLLSFLGILSGGLALGQVVVPDYWTIDNGIETYQESADPHGGSFACQIDVISTNASQCDLINSTVIPVTAGETYKFKYWYKSSANVQIKGHLIWDNGDQSWVTANTGVVDWTSKAKNDVVPAGATSLTIEFRFAGGAGMVPGETQFLDDVTFESPSGTTLLFNNGDFESWPAPVIDPEPTNYPTNFRDTAHALVMIARWAEDTIGPDFPSGYLLYGSKEGYTAPVPVDGIPVDDDLDWSDCVVAINRLAGMSVYDFTNLETATAYTVKIYPYSNTGAVIDYKTDGSVPEAYAETVDANIIHAEDFEGTSISWTGYNVTGVDEWDFPLFNGKTTAKVDGNSGGSFHVNEDWLISPALDLSSFNNAFFSFQNIRSLDGPLLELKVSTNYDGSSDPNTATWVDLTSMATWSEGNYQAAVTEDLDLTAFVGGTAYIAFKYTSTDTEGVLYKLDNFQVYSYNPFINVSDPNGGEIIYLGTQYDITWNHEYWDETSIAIYLTEGPNNTPTMNTNNAPVGPGSYTWNVPSGYSPGTEYKIFLQSPMGVEDYSDDYFTLAEPGTILAGFEADNTVVLVGDSVMFTDNSIGSPTSWLWTFEGGTPETYDGQVPPYIHYNEAGAWDVTLEVSDGTTSDVILKEDFIHSGFAPVADFEADQTSFVAGSFTNFSSLATGEGLTYAWTFEGGTPETSSDENPSDIYYNINADSTYDVTLTVSNMFGESTLTREDYIHTTATGIADINVDESTIQVYPNPASGYFVMNSTQKGLAMMFDATGKAALSTDIEAGENKLSVRDLDNGLYFISIILEDGTRHSTKIIIQ